VKFVYKCHRVKVKVTGASWSRLVWSKLCTENKIAFYCKADHPRLRAFTYAWSLPVMWQRWQSYHSICHSRKPHTTCKPHGCMFYRTGVMATRSFTLREYGFSTFLPLWPWP